MGGDKIEWKGEKHGTMLMYRFLALLASKFATAVVPDGS